MSNYINKTSSLFVKINLDNSISIWYTYNQMKEESTMVFDLKEGMIVKLRNGNYAVVANLDHNRSASPCL